MSLEETRLMLGKKDKNTATPKVETERGNGAALPLFLCLACMTVCLAACLIDAFVHPLGSGLLAPVIVELLAIALPCYLALMAVYPQRSATRTAQALGFRAIKAKYIFFIIFSALFMMSASMLISILLGGVSSAAEGLTLLGTFTAGQNEFSVSWPYLVLVYAVVPALAEEVLLRGIVFSELRGVGFAARATVSAVMSALIGFSLGGAIPAIFVSLCVSFVLYTTESLWACVAVHFLFNLYRLYIEGNVAAYYESTSSSLLILTVLCVALLIFGALFFAESSKLYRERAASVRSGERQGSSLSVDTLWQDLKQMLAEKHTIILLVLCAVIFIAATAVGYFK